MLRQLGFVLLFLVSAPAFGSIELTLMTGANFGSGGELNESLDDAFDAVDEIDLQWQFGLQGLYYFDALPIGVGMRYSTYIEAGTYGITDGVYGLTADRLSLLGAYRFIDNSEGLYVGGLFGLGIYGNATLGLTGDTTESYIGSHDLGFNLAGQVGYRWGKFFIGGELGYNHMKFSSVKDDDGNDLDDEYDTLDLSGIYLLFNLGWRWDTN